MKPIKKETDRTIFAETVFKTSKQDKKKAIKYFKYNKELSDKIRLTRASFVLYNKTRILYTEFSVLDLYQQQIMPNNDTFRFLYGRNFITNSDVLWFYNTVTIGFADFMKRGCKNIKLG